MAENSLKTISFLKQKVEELVNQIKCTNSGLGWLRLVLTWIHFKSVPIDIK